SASFSRPRVIRPATPTIRVYEARMLNLESRSCAVEAFLPAAPVSRARRRVNHRSATISVAGYVFDLNRSLLFKPAIIAEGDRTKYNIDVHEKVFELAGNRFKDGARMALDQRLDHTVVVAIDERIRNVFDYQVKTHKLSMLSMNERYAKKIVRKSQKMRSAKCATRQRWFNAALEHLSTGYGTQEKCEALFQMNDFFHNLDIGHMRALSSRRVERKFTVIEQEMPLTKSDKVVHARAIRS
ncbi:hypothetical protein EDC96DRAFT_580916, partial [Choanephora cucurbitarum]